MISVEWIHYEFFLKKSALKILIIFLNDTTSIRYNNNSQGVERANILLLSHKYKMIMTEVVIEKIKRDLRGCAKIEYIKNLLHFI
jgi:hypothetical protein